MSDTSNQAPLGDGDVNELAVLLHEFITAPTFYAKQRLVEGNQTLLLSSEADSALAALIFEYADHDEMRESLTLHRTILERCRSDGIRETFVQIRQQIGDRGDLSALSAEEAQALVNTIGEFITTGSWEDAQAYLGEHPELLSPQADAVIERLIETHTRRQEANVVRQLVVHRDLLRAAREMGEHAAFERVLNPPDTLDMIVENTIAVLTEHRQERGRWLATVRMSGIRAGELGDEQMVRLLSAVEALLTLEPQARSQPGEVPAPELEGAYAEAWTQITDAASPQNHH